jgi:hypothetical protein
MILENTSTDTYPNHLKTIKELFYNKYGLSITQLVINPESKEYEACSFLLNEKKVVYRQAKITPTKAGQFVTVWKRNALGITAPFNSKDVLDFIIITVKTATQLGQFIFPKAVLATKGILTHNEKDGKRGIRVYAPWDSVSSKQAIQTQAWQTDYFLALDDSNSFDIVRAKALLELKK